MKYTIQIEAQADILEINKALQLVLGELGNKVVEYSICYTPMYIEEKQS